MRMLRSGVRPGSRSFRVAEAAALEPARNKILETASPLRGPLRWGGRSLELWRPSDRRRLRSFGFFVLLYGRLLQFCLIATVSFWSPTPPPNCAVLKAPH